MSVRRRLDKVEVQAAPAGGCTHRIPILYDGDPEPEITCGCPRTHNVVVVCYPDGQRVPRCGPERATL
jgi:hypothetical protein